jgi:hypothetical protein
MSIFDVIKYGNTDLANPDELGELPKQIFWTYYYKVSSDHIIYSDEMSFRLKCINLGYRYSASRVPTYKIKLAQLFKETLLEHQQ